MLLRGTDGARLMQLDEQKLNPQWIVTTPIKKLFPEGSSPYNFFHKLGGIPMDGIVGYKRFTIKQNYLHDGNDIFPIYKDPASVSNLGLPWLGSGDGINR